MKKRNKIVFILPVILLIAFVVSCTEKTYTPKPRGYFNIETPTPEYVKFDSACEYTMEVSKYARMIQSPDAKEKGNCWFNVYYPKFDATIYLTYDPVKNNLKKYLDDSHELVYKHVVKSSGISEALISDKASGVYGMKYKIEGEAACPYQFYLTDSTQHFFRAALYFNFKPNYDSLYQVVNFIEADMDHMIQTFEWTFKPHRGSSWGK
jgi:gliding motility-associated lipoprotein GldD